MSSTAEFSQLVEKNPGINLYAVNDEDTLKMLIQKVFVVKNKKKYMVFFFPLNPQKKKVRISRHLQLHILHILEFALILVLATRFLNYQKKKGGEIMGRVKNTLSYLPTIPITISPAQVGAATTSEQAFTCAGLRANDVVQAVKPTLQAGLAVASARVTTVNQVLIMFVNASAAPITPTGAEVYKIVCVGTSG